MMRSSLIVVSDHHRGLNLDSDLDPVLTFVCISIPQYIKARHRHRHRHRHRKFTSDHHERRRFLRFLLRNLFLCEEALGLPAGSPVPTAGSGNVSTMAEAVGVDPEAERDAAATASGDGSEPGSGVRPSHRNSF
jgi:hypothetical protein